MSAEIKTSFLADTKGYVKDVDKMIDALEDNEDALKDLAREGDRAGEKLEDSLRDVAREAKRTGNDVADAGQDGFRRLGDSGAEVGQELRQNLGETFSSFRGDLEDLPQIAQDTLGGLAGSGALGGIPGLAATAAGAAGLGLVIAALDEAGKRQEALEQKASDWANAYIEAGGRVITAAQQVAIYNEIATDPEKFKEAQKNADLWGVSLGVALNAMAGNTWAVEEAQAALNKRHDEFAADLGDRNQKVLDESAALSGWRKAIQDGQNALDDITGSMQLGATQADAYSESLRLMAEHTIGATKTVDEFGDAIYTLPDETKVYIDAETGQATQDVEAIEKKIYSLPANTLLKVDADLSGAESKIQQFIQKDRTIRVTIDGKSYGRY
jgi:hypothetical protein